MVDRPKCFHGYFWVMADSDRLQFLQWAELLLAIEDLAYPLLIELRLWWSVQLQKELLR